MHGRAATAAGESQQNEQQSRAAVHCRWVDFGHPTQHAAHPALKCWTPFVQDSSARFRGCRQSPKLQPLRSCVLSCAFEGGGSSYQNGELRVDAAPTRVCSQRQGDLQLRKQDRRRLKFEELMQTGFLNMWDPDSKPHLFTLQSTDNLAQSY